MEVIRQKQQIVHKAGVLEFVQPDVSFDHVGGLANLKAWFRMRREAFPQFPALLPEPTLWLAVGFFPFCESAAMASRSARRTQTLPGRTSTQLNRPVNPHQTGFAGISAGTF